MSQTTLLHSIGFLSDHLKRTTSKLYSDIVCHRPEEDKSKSELSADQWFVVEQILVLLV